MMVPEISDGCTAGGNSASSDGDMNACGRTSSSDLVTLLLALHDVCPGPVAPSPFTFLLEVFLNF